MKSINYFLHVNALSDIALAFERFWKSPRNFEGISVFFSFLPQLFRLSSHWRRYSDFKIQIHNYINSDSEIRRQNHLFQSHPKNQKRELNSQQNCFADRVVISSIFVLLKNFEAYYSQNYCLWRKIWQDTAENQKSLKRYKISL